MASLQPISTREKIREIIRQIPVGKVATYGQVAELAANGCGTRQVVSALRSSSSSDNLPWHRVVNSKGGISLPRGDGYESQKQLLEKERVKFSANDYIDLSRYLWQPPAKDENTIMGKFRPWITPGKDSAGTEDKGTRLPDTENHGKLPATHKDHHLLMSLL